MVQILTPPKSFGAELAGNIGRGLGEGFSSAMKSRSQSKAMEQEDKEILERTGINLSGIRDPETRKAVFISELQGKRLGEEYERKGEFLGKEYGLKEQIESGKSERGTRRAIDVEKLKHAHDIELEDFKQAGDILRSEGKRSPEDIKKEEQEQIRQTAQQSFNGIANILKKGKVGMGSKVLNFFGGKGAEDIGQFETLTGGLESMLVDMVNRGALSNSRFQYITETLLPKPTDTQSKIKGKLKGLAQLLKLDSSELTGKGSEEKNERPPLSSFHR